MAEKKYAVNAQSFEKIRREDYYYVDKTDMVYGLTQKYTSVFLARPRRFGKTLLTQTLDAYFSGEHDLFEGLKIAEMEKNWNSYPVLHFDLSGMKLGTVADVRNGLDEVLTLQENRYQVKPTHKAPRARVQDLIMATQEKYGLPAVVIIDEYDAPVLDAYGSKSEDGIRKELMAFFSPLKKFEKNLRFVFLTGVTKFSTLSIFSSLNTLTDISILPEYNSLCGFTDKEIDETLEEGIARIAKEQGKTYDDIRGQLKEKYDGYRFSMEGEGIYNPFSVLNALNSGMLDPYWFGTATPTFITKALRDTNLSPEDLKDQELDRSAFDTPIEPADGEINPIALLYQSGYFTIKSYDPVLEAYTVGIPNEEVREGLMKILLPYYLGDSSLNRQAVMLAKRLSLAIANDDTDEMRDLLVKFFNTIPYGNFKLPEEHYKTVLYIIFSLTRQFVSAETRSSLGRMDIVLFSKRNIYIMELKLDGSTERAAEQINLKRYAERFDLSGKAVVKIAVNFSSKTHNIDKWKLID